MCWQFMNIFPSVTKKYFFPLLAPPLALPSTFKSSCVFCSWQHHNKDFGIRTELATFLMMQKAKSGTACIRPAVLASTCLLVKIKKDKNKIFVCHVGQCDLRSRKEPCAVTLVMHVGPTTRRLWNETCPRQGEMQCHGTESGTSKRKANTDP